MVDGRTDNTRGKCAVIRAGHLTLYGSAPLVVHPTNAPQSQVIHPPCSREMPLRAAGQ